jgi:hypothetical protein
MTDTPPDKIPPAKPRRGPPLGNKNAVKHGFYAHSFHKVEGGKLDTDLQGKFDDEIALMRILILRTADSIKDSSHMTTDEYLASLRGITLAIGRLESIYRTQKEVYKAETTLENALEELKYLEWDED